MDENMTADNNEEFEKEAPANETKGEKFLRLAPPRVNKIINGINSLKKLSSKSSYDYSEEQVEKMISAIRAALDDCEQSFKPKEKKENGGFSF